MKAKKKLVVRSKEEAKNVMFWLEEDIPKVENTLFQWILQDILENQTFQRLGKFIMVDLYEMDFMKGIVKLVKVNEMYNILKSAGHCLLVERWDRNGWYNPSFFAGDMPIRLLCPSLSKGET